MHLRVPIGQFENSLQPRLCLYSNWEHRALDLVFGVDEQGELASQKGIECTTPSGNDCGSIVPLLSLVRPEIVLCITFVTPTCGRLLLSLYEHLGLMFVFHLSPSFRGNACIVAPI